MLSQNGEDLIIDCLIAMLPGKVPDYALEIGADCPNGTNIECNTIHLLYRGWRGLLIDEDELPYSRSKKQHVTVENLPGCLIDWEVPLEIGVLSIDVDGIDYWLWRALPTE